MGGELDQAKKGQRPSFLIQAAKDPLSHDLEIVQIIKGWVDAKGKSHEKIYDVARADITKSKVDLDKAVTEHQGGVAQFSLHWQDPDFDPAQNAFYYVRAGNANLSPYAA